MAKKKMTFAEAGKLGWEKTKHIHLSKSDSFRDAYARLGKVCLYCNTPIPYEKRDNKFCNHSCAAQQRNLGICRVNRRKPKECASCGSFFDCRWSRENCFSCKPKYVRTFRPKSSSHPQTVRSYLLRTRDNSCSSCERSSWIGEPIPLEVDHVDGDSKNNDEENLRLLCPNCHAMTPTYKARNRGNGRANRMDRYHSGLSW